MELIILIMIIITNSITITNILKKKIEYTIPITVIIMTIIVYIFGLFDNLDLGVKVVEGISIIATIYNLLIIIKSIKSKQIKEKLERIITPGLLVYVLLYILFIIINKGRVFEWYDEFNHWGLIVKNMYLYNGYGTVENSIITFNEYPPFTASFQYIMLNIKGIYVEDLILIAKDILYLSIIIPICGKINFKKDLKKLFFIVLAILILPIILYKDFFAEILVDGFLGILFGIGLFIIYKNIADKKYQKIMITLIITSLCMTKTTGIILGILLLIFYIIKIVINKEKLVNILIIAIIPTILTSAWYIKINCSQVQNEWDFQKTIQGNQNIEKNKQIIDKFIEAFFENDEIIGSKLSMICKLLLLGAYSLYVSKKLKTEKEKKSYKYTVIATIISIIIFAIGLLWMYLTIFTTKEAEIAASYDRYMNTIILSWLTLNTWIISEEEINLRVLYVFMAISISILPNDTIYTRYIQSSQDIKRTNIERSYYYSKFKQCTKVIEEDEKVYFISQTRLNNEKVLKLCKYEMMTNNIANKSPKVNESKEQFTQTLLKENYSYVYIFIVEDDFKEKYKSLFKEEQINSKTLYRINEVEQGKIQLEKVM